MSSYEDIADDVYAALNNVTTGVGVDVSADIRQRGGIIPAVVFTIEDAEFTRYMSGSVAPVHCRVRIDCLHDSRLEAQDLAKAVRSALGASSLVHSLEMESTDLFNRGADIEPVYLTSATYVITCSTIEAP